MTLETRELLADTRGYSRHMAARTMLSHAVEIDDEGREVRVLCGRVKLENLADPCAGDANARPTCGVCARRDTRVFA